MVVTGMRDVILIIEDDPEVAATLQFQLEREGFTPRLALTGLSGIAEAVRVPLPDAILLDLGLPDASGFEVFELLREHQRARDIPVVICSARRDVEDRIRGFELGAADYVMKPFAMAELVARIRTILRRVRGADGTKTHLRVSSVRIDRDSHRVWAGDQQVDLTAVEFRLLWELMKHPDRVLTRDALLNSVWGIEGSSETRTIDAHVRRLREKLGEFAAHIETVRGVGYRFRPDQLDD